MIQAASNRAPCDKSDFSGRRGMTLVEMLVATAVTLILIGLVVQLFGVVGGSITASRSLIESTGQLRSAAFRLRTDLSGITAVPQPPAKPEFDSGYLEIIEGPTTDVSAAPYGILGDYDDVLMFTTRSQGSPFVGTFSGSQIESMTAEVAWFCQPASVQPISGLTLYNLYRKQMLVMGIVGAGSFSASNSMTGATIPTVYNSYDISLRPEGSTLYANSLGDLTKRESISAHPLLRLGCQLSVFMPDWPHGQWHRLRRGVRPPGRGPDPHQRDRLRRSRLRSRGRDAIKRGSGPHAWRSWLWISVGDFSDSQRCLHRPWR